MRSDGYRDVTRDVPAESIRRDRIHEITMQRLLDGRLRRTIRTLGAACVSLAVGLAAAACAPDGPGKVLSADSDGKGSVTVAWSAPTRDSTGSELTDLAGFRVYYGGTSPLSRGRATRVDVGTDTTHTVDSLEAGTYYFAVSAVDTAGNESGLSSELEVQVP